MILRSFYLILTLLFVLLLFFVLWSYRDGRRLRRQFHQRLDRLEQHYRDFIRRQAATLHLRKGDAIGVEALVQEAHTLLKPDLDLLFTLLENQRGSALSLRYQQGLFALLAAKMDKYLLETNPPTGSPVPLSLAEQAALHQVVMDILRADLQNQILSWQAGESLG